MMASINRVGLTEHGRDRLPRFPFMRIRNGWGALNRHQALRLRNLYGLAQASGGLAGADHMHVNGIGNKFSETDDSVVTSAKAA